MGKQCGWKTSIKFKANLVISNSFQTWFGRTLCEKGPYSELFWSAFPRIRTRITPNTDTFYAMVSTFGWSLLFRTENCISKLIPCRFHRSILNYCKTIQGNFIVFPKSIFYFCHNMGNCKEKKLFQSCKDFFSFLT